MGTKVVDLIRYITGKYPVADGIDKVNTRIPLINTAHRRVSKALKLSKDYTGIKLVDGVILYDLPSDFSEATLVLLDGRSLTPTTEKKLDNMLSDWRNNKGTPTSYFIRKGQNKIGFYPVPDINQNLKVLTITYIYIQPWVDESGTYDKLNTPEEYDDMIMDFVIWHIAESVYDTTTATRHAQIFAAREQELLESESRDQEDEYPTTIDELPKRRYRSSSYLSITSND